MKRVRFKRVSTKTPEQLRQMAELAEARKKRMKRLLTALDIRHADIFGYEPDYTFPGYRSRCGAFTTVLLMFAVLLRVVTRGLDFLNPQAIISENRLLFERDMQEAFELPKFGLVFKRTGWKPFYDPTYFTFRFQQGISPREQLDHQDLGDRPFFVDAHGRIIEDEARCPTRRGPSSATFSRPLPLHPRRDRALPNGTDDGPLDAGASRRPDEIDALIYETGPWRSRSATSTLPRRRSTSI